MEQQALADATRDATVAAERDFHNLMLGAEGQVKAQYGANSDQPAAVGKKKKSEHKPPGRRSTAPTKA